MTQIVAVIAGLALVLALAYAGLWLLRRIQPGLGRGAPLEFLFALQLGARERVVLVRWRQELLLLGVAGGGVTLLAQRPEATAADAGNAPAVALHPPPEDLLGPMSRWAARRIPTSGR